MKKLSVEEKARRYDEILTRAEGANIPYYEDSIMSKVKEFVDYLIPELRESEDERIKNLLYCLIRDRSDNRKLLENSGVSVDMALAWIEKQGEQKPAESPKDYHSIDPHFGISVEDLMTKKNTDDNKVEPKFHEGEWVVNRFGDVWHIDSFDSKNYQVSNEDRYCYFPIEKQNEMHLWTISDAKDGDVLASKEGDDILIFRKIEDNVSFSSYCNINKKVEHYWSKNRFMPATKEQRDLLFQKMKEAGYEWDAEKKELKKIEENSFESDMDALYTYIYNPQYFNPSDPRMELVELLYQDLKKLK